MDRWQIGMCALALLFLSLVPCSDAHSERDWALTIYSGRLTDADLAKAATFNFEFENAYLIDLGLSRRLYTFQNYFDIEIESQIAKYFGDQDLIGGWQIQGVYTYQSGFPIPFGQYNPTTSVTSGDLLYNGGDIKIDDPTTDRWFNTDAFTSIQNDTLTNATPVNHLRTVPYRFDDVRRDAINNIDLSLIKDFVIKNDVRLQVRAEFINAFNEAYFPNPVVGAASSTFGQETASNQENYARRAQVGVKFVF